MTSFLRILSKVTMFQGEQKRGNGKQTTSLDKAGNLVSSGSSYFKLNKKENLALGRIHLNGAVTERDFENIHHRIVRKI